jgi:proline iminopeptidase
VAILLSPEKLSARSKLAHMLRRSLLLLLLALPISAATFKAADGTLLHYDVIGKGRPVVFLAGGPGFSPGYLEPVAKGIEGKFARILFHQRGTGRSTMETINAETLALPTLISDLEALRMHLSADSLTLVGHSFGGILAMQYAASHPDRVRALALIDSGGPTLTSVPGFITNLGSRMTAEDTAKVKEWSTPERLKNEHKRAVLEITRAKTPAYFADRAKATRMMVAFDETSFHDGVFWAITPQLMGGLDLRQPLAAVKAPVLVIHGRQDPLESAQEVHETFPTSELVWIENAGHFPWEEQPAAVFLPLAKFLRKVVQR